MNVNLAKFYYAGCCAKRNCLEIKWLVSERENDNVLLRWLLCEAQLFGNKMSSEWMGIWQLFIMLVFVRIAAVWKLIVHWINVNLATFIHFFCCMYRDSLEIKCPVSECESGNDLWQWLLYISHQLVNEMFSEWTWICQRFIILAVVCTVAIWKLNIQWVVLKVFSFIQNKWMLLLYCGNLEIKYPVSGAKTLMLYRVC